MSDLPVGGHVTVRAKAMERVFAALAADSLGVDPHRVAARVTDERGAVSVDVVGPVASRREGTVMDAAARARERVGVEGSSITGATIGAVRIRITEFDTSTRRRVA